MKAYKPHRRHIVSLILCLALTLGFVPNSIAASQRLSVESKNAKSGESVKIAVSLEGNPGICAFMLDVTYDTSKLEYLSSSLGSSFQSGLANESSGRVQVLWDDTKDYSGNGEIVALTFRVKQNVSGDAAISAYFTDCYNFNDVDVTFEQGRGSVQITSASTSTTPTTPTTSTTPSGPSSFTGNLDFKDANEIKYKEAVSAMAKLGILEGYEGIFRPAVELKRSEASKILAYMITERKTAEDLVGTGQFKDVPVNHWASGYVDYCVQKGIINGRGGGMFDPDGALTIVDFEKMLLCCLGYDAQKEGFIGSDYKINVTAMAKALNIGEGLRSGASPNDVVTREEASQMAYNALLKQVVTYQSGKSGAQTTGKTLLETYWPDAAAK